MCSFVFVVADGLSDAAAGYTRVVAANMPLRNHSSLWKKRKRTVQLLLETAPGAQYLRATNLLSLDVSSYFQVYRIARGHSLELTLPKQNPNLQVRAEDVSRTDRFVWNEVCNNLTQVL
jgi:hypothetical protein